MAIVSSPKPLTVAARSSECKLLMALHLGERFECPLVVEGGFHLHSLLHYFSGLRAVFDFNLSIDPGEVHGLIGPNGAGKTTIFNLITGIYRPTEGKILLEGRSIVGLRPYEIAAAGLGRTFQNLRLWRHMTVLEHVKLAHYLSTCW